MVIKFKDRKDAAKKLSLSLEKYREKNPVVLAIPKGGVEIGYELSRFLQSDFSIVITRKLPLPHNPEAGFGAIAEDGSMFIFKDIYQQLDEKIVNEIKRQQQAEIERRKLVLRKNRSLPNIQDRIVILADDGIAMGSTMRATIKMCKKKNPKKIIIAAPVAGHRVAKEIDALVDEIIILTTPRDFQAVAQVYENWYDVPDEEVIAIMDQWMAQRVRT
jgi:predicted phosphoribosyltransferase